MLNKFKSALYNVVGNFDPTDGGTSASPGIVSLASGVPNAPSLIHPNIQGREKTLKYAYTRPHFLQLNSEDEILVSADHALRPIICPRDISQLPWNSGYAETVNAGKSKKNEDQAAVHVGVLTRVINQSCNKTVSSSSQASKLKASNNGISSTLNGVVQDTKQKSKSTHITTSQPIKILSASRLSDPLIGGSTLPTVNHEENTISLPYYYFGVFDGHAGWGAAVSAASQLHHILHEKMCNVIELIIPDQESDNDVRGPLWPPEKTVSPESAVIGALEQAFWTMDHQIGEERQRHNLTGGCTACVALFILGKVFVSNAGDSRGVIALKSNPISMSFDFTPETETQRIRKIGAKHPELLGGEFTHLEFLRRPMKSDVGKKAVYRDHYMKGWSLKIITEADLKHPLVCGEGKRSRVLATIGVTRGFGDHDLKAQFSSLPIKPFLSPEPEVRILDLRDLNISDRDVLVLGTDGLWDIMSNEKAVSAVFETLQQFSPNDLNRYKYRYTSAAHDLVLWSRGRLKDHNWRTADDKHATIDDISVFVIPLKPYKEEFERWRNVEAAIDSSEEALERPLLQHSDKRTPEKSCSENLSNGTIERHCSTNAFTTNSPPTDSFSNANVNPPPLQSLLLSESHADKLVIDSLHTPENQLSKSLILASTTPLTRSHTTVSDTRTNVTPIDSHILALTNEYSSSFDNKSRSLSYTGSLSKSTPNESNFVDSKLTCTSTTISDSFSIPLTQQNSSENSSSSISNPSLVPSTSNSLSVIHNECVPITSNLNLSGDFSVNVTRSSLNCEIQHLPTPTTAASLLPDAEDNVEEVTSPPKNLDMQGE